MGRSADILQASRAAFLASTPLVTAVPLGPEHRRSKGGGDLWCVHYVSHVDKERISCGIALHRYVLTVLVYGSDGANAASDLIDELQTALTYAVFKVSIPKLVDMQETDDEVDLEIDEVDSHDCLLARSDWLITIET